MFEFLIQCFFGIIECLCGCGCLIEENICEVICEVCIVLFEVDVVLLVVQVLIECIKVCVVGQEVLKLLILGQVLIKVVCDELIVVMGVEVSDLNFNVFVLVIILMVGLQGVGKIIMVGKLVKYLKEKCKKKVMVVLVDVYCLVVIEQLKILVEQVGVLFFLFSVDQKLEVIVCVVIDDVCKLFVDVLLVDIVGCLVIDEVMMVEIKVLYVVVNLVEILFVVDVMIGQDVVNIVKVFGDVLLLIGVVLIKIDGDVCGGVVLSVCYIIGKLIKFVGVSEKLEGLDVFYLDCIVSCIFDMGDVLLLVEQVEQQVDKDKVVKLVEKVVKGKKFDLNDMCDQFEQMQNMGGIGGLMDKLLGLGNIFDYLKQQVSQGKEVLCMIVIIGLMIKKEWCNLNLFNGLCCVCIVKGLGVMLVDVNKLMKQYMQMEKMMSKMVGGGMKGMLCSMKGMMGVMGGRGMLFC